jgi:hypothetical protein
MQWVRGRDALAALAIALVAGTIAVSPPFDLLHGWSIDILTALRWRVFGGRYDPASSPAVVIGIDEETYKLSVQAFAHRDLDTESAESLRRRYRGRT